MRANCLKTHEPLTIQCEKRKSNIVPYVFKHFPKKKMFVNEFD